MLWIQHETMFHIYFEIYITAKNIYLWLKRYIYVKLAVATSSCFNSYLNDQDQKTFGFQSAPNKCLICVIGDSLAKEQQRKIWSEVTSDVEKWKVNKELAEDKMHRRHSWKHV